MEGAQASFFANENYALLREAGIPHDEAMDVVQDPAMFLGVYLPVREADVSHAEVLDFVRWGLPYHDLRFYAMARQGGALHHEVKDAVMRLDCDLGRYARARAEKRATHWTAVTASLP